MRYSRYETARIGDDVDTGYTSPCRVGKSIRLLGVYLFVLGSMAVVGLVVLVGTR